MKATIYSLKNNTVLQLIFWHLAFPAMFFLIVALMVPFSDVFEFSKDEGVNLVKAMMLDLDYSLYSEIWSDQPPLFTYLLFGVMRFLGFEVDVGRFMVLIFSCILIWASMQFLRIAWDNATAIAGFFLLFLLPQYIGLSVAVMIGLPAITLAMLSLLALTLWHTHHRSFWLVLSAIALGLSVLTKLFTGFLAPIFVIGVLFAEFYKTRNIRSWLKIVWPAFLWAAVFILFLIVSGLLLIGMENIYQLVEPHLVAIQVDTFREREILTIGYHLSGVPIFLYLALLGCILAITSRRWLMMYPFAWALGAYLLLLNHAPVWDHQQLLVTIPIVLLGAHTVAVGVRLLIQAISSHGRVAWVPAAALLGVFILLFTFRDHQSIDIISPNSSFLEDSFKLGPKREKFRRVILKYAPETQWMVTDMHMYAFRAGLPVPPNLAVVTMKRVLTGNLTDAEVLETIRNYDPEQVLLGRFEYPLTQVYLENKYRLVHSDDDVYLYIRNDLSGQPE